MKICSGDICPTVCVTEASQLFSTTSPNTTDISGTISHHTANEPRQMMNEYFRPMMYPKPTTAALVFTLNTSFSLSATTSP